MVSKLVFIYDGECPFCRHFAEIQELRTSIPNLEIRDGRIYQELLMDLAQEGYSLNKGAILLAGGDILQGNEAIQWICSKITPSWNLYSLLLRILSIPMLIGGIYPLMLYLRRRALNSKQVPLEPLKNN